MPKRKRSEESDPAGSIRDADLASGRKRQSTDTKGRLQAIFEHCKKQLFRALKLARGLEQRNLGKRRKKARQSKKDGDISRLEEEAKALKVGARWTLLAKSTILTTDY